MNNDKAVIQSSKWIGWVILLVGVSAFAFASYLLWKQLKAPELAGGGAEGNVDQAPGSSTPPNRSNTGVPQPPTKSKFPLLRGSRGSEVSMVQKYLNIRYGLDLVEDGIWGSKTDAAIQKYALTNSVSIAEYNKMVQWLSNPPKNTGIYTGGRALE